MAGTKAECANTANDQRPVPGRFSIYGAFNTEFFGLTLSWPNFFSVA
jgi:hypothetical protein